MSRYAVYDFETLLNCFTAVFKDFKTGVEREFVIHESRNDFREFMKFLRKLKKHGYYMVGYNNVGFDAQIIEYLINNRNKFQNFSGEMLADRISKQAQKIIRLPDEEKFKQLVPEWHMTIPQLDVYKQRHYDSKNKRTSLKWLQFTMRFNNIQSMPVRHDEYISTEMIPSVLAYNRNDVVSTFDFFTLIKFETDLRLKLSEKYDLTLMNASEPKMARDIFGKILSEEMGIPYRDLKEMRTYRDSISGKEVIFPYIKFRDPVLKGIHKFFYDLKFNPYNFEENSYGIKEVKKNFKYHNIAGDVGLGGIHACVNPGVYNDNCTITKVENDLIIAGKWILEDIDGTSYYPNLGIQNNLYPEHLSSLFCKVYNDIFEMRQKIDKKDPVNYIYKIILNSTYGLSKEPNNYMHDPKYTFAITINGQLLLLKLAEMMKENVPGVMFYQFNTDGITIGYDPKYRSIVEKVKAQWTKYTRIQLENNFYKKMVIMDVNNYIAVDYKGNVKRKGLFGYSMKPEDREMDYHKNPSALIIPKALEAYFVKDIPIEKTIEECSDIYDFCLGVKIKRDFDLIQFKLDPKSRKVKSRILHEQVARYFISKDNCSLKKKYNNQSKKPGKYVNLQKGWNMSLLNNHVAKPIKDYKIDHRFYLRKAREVIQEIDPSMGKQATLNFG